MKSAFRRISRVRSLTGSIKWYLSEDCLLSAKLMMYAVEYRRFYLRDLESVVVWPSRLWLLRLIVPTALVEALGGWIWNSFDSTTGEIIVGLGLAWLGLELALGPTANSRVSTRGMTVDLPLVRRIRRAPKVLAKIDAAVRATGEPTTPSTLVTGPLEPFLPPISETNAS